MKRLTRLFLRHDIGNAVALARYYHRLGMACARRSVEAGDSWMVAARRHWEVRDARLWEARQLAK